MTAIYHITHVNNLAAILRERQLVCDAEAARRQLPAQGIGHSHIKERRARSAVPVGPRGVLADYVPFYFAPRSPMLYAIHTGFVQGYTGGEREVVHLVSSVEVVAGRELPFVFSVGHAVVSLSRFFTELTHLADLDWPVMELTYWNDTQADPDRSRRRQAEFLVHRSFAWELVTEVGVLDEAMHNHVEDVLSAAGATTPVVNHRDWYYMRELER